ncbi:MAG: hypothetical protein R3357_11655 [Burkholderiales bacterium]|nr:hypothetical protein [Burkholderiales bacterium]
MYGVVGVLLICLGLLVFRAAYVGARMHPVPRWISEGMQAYVVVPFIVTALLFGVAATATWLFGAHWRTQSAIGWGAMAATVAGYLLVSRAMRVWAASQPAPLAVVEGRRPQDPGRPPQQPPLKKAA